MVVVNKITVPASTGFHIYDTHVNYPTVAQIGVVGNAKAGMVKDLHINNSIFSAQPDVAGGPWPVPSDQKWTVRLYNLDNAVIENSIFRNNHKEHFLYLGTEGNLTIRNCTFADTGSQAIQVANREQDSFHGVAANVPGLLTINKCKIDRCAQPYGTRQSWNISLFGFETVTRDAAGNITGKHRGESFQDVVISGCEINGSGYEHTASGGRDCNSTGAILVEYRPNVLINRVKCNFVRPDRGVIHLTGNKNVTMSMMEVWGGDIVIAKHLGTKVKIYPGVGDADICLLDEGTNQVRKVSTLKAGYSQ